MNSPIIQLEINCGLKRIRVFADSPAERQSGLETLLEISPELQRIEEKLNSTPGQRALAQS